MSLNDLLSKRRDELGIDGPPADYKVSLTVVPDEQRDAHFMGRCTSWASKALHGRASTLAAMNIGDGRNDYLNKSAYVLLRFAAAGHLDAQEVYDTLGEADGGITYPATRGTLDSAAKAAERDGPVDPPVDSDAAPRDFFADLDLARSPEPAAPAAPAEGAAATPAAPIVEETPEEREERMHRFAVKKELAILRAREDAKRIFADEQAMLSFRTPTYRDTLTDELLLPDEETQYAIAGVLPVGANAALTAQYKTGKTTMMNNLIRSWADGEPFLGRFDMAPQRGRAAIFNYELSEGQYRRWLREAGVVNTDAVSVLHLRGYRLPLTSSRVEDWIVSWLKDHDIRMWVVDPFARAAVGTDENSNTEVGVWLDTFDVIKARAGVSEAVLPMHTGRAEQEQGAERARGATRLDDWADVRWLLTKDKQDNRYFRATGRDVEQAEEKLTYNDLDRSYRIGGGDKKWVEKRRIEDAVVHFVRDHPGCSQSQVESGVEGGTNPIRSALQAARMAHRIRVEEGVKEGRRGSWHYANV